MWASVLCSVITLRVGCTGLSPSALACDLIQCSHAEGDCGVDCAVGCAF